MERCRNCGCRKEEHGGADNPHRPYACPAVQFFGHPAPFPMTTYKSDPDGKKLDRKLARYWLTKTTCFAV